MNDDSPLRREQQIRVAKLRERTPGKSPADKKRGTSHDAPLFAIQNETALVATALAGPQSLLSTSTVTPVIVMSTATAIASVAIVDPEGDDTAG